MRYVLFDLGDTLESNDALRPGALEAPTPAAIPAIVEQYRQLLKDLGLEPLFQPFDQAVTLSTQVGVRKPDARIFRAALDKFDRTARLSEAIFITENTDHVSAARRLGLLAVHLRGPEQQEGEVQSLEALVPHVEGLLCGDR